MIFFDRLQQDKEKMQKEREELQSQKSDQGRIEVEINTKRLSELF